MKGINGCEGKIFSLNRKPILYVYSRLVISFFFVLRDSEEPIIL